MASVYTSFLQSPSASVLAANASLNYISTTTTIHEPAAILKHLQAQAKQLQKKDEKVLSTIEGDHGVCVETETTLQFTSGGGAFLPGIDENLLDEKTVVFPMVHVVTLDADKKITQIRLYWEQGTLLRQIEAIGRTGRNWPIRDGKALVDTVKNSLKAAGHDTSANGSLALSDPSQIVISEREKSGSISATRDPHASLSLFSPRDPNKESERSYDGPATAPRASAKPAPRDYSELFAGEEEEAPTGSAQRSLSPSKMDGRDMKANSGKHFTANRIFDESSPLDPPKSPERKKTYGQKYEHFAFGDGEDEPHDTRPRSKGSKGMSHFSFEDFSTPPSVKEKPRPDYERHWGAGVDEEEPPGSPERREVVHKPRPDADPHFRMTDDSPSVPAEKGRPTTNVDNARRGQDFGAHYEISDRSPAGGDARQQHKANSNAQRSNLEAHWDFGTPVQEKKIYKTAGDGMGGRGGRSWGLGDESDPEVEKDIRATARARRAQQSQTGAGAEF